MKHNKLWKDHPFEDVFISPYIDYKIGWAFGGKITFYSKLSEKAWFLEIGKPFSCPFDIGEQFILGNSNYRKIDDTKWIIEVN